MKKTPKVNIIKIIAVVIAALNLLALFVFDYKIPFINKHTDAESDISEAAVTSNYQITFAENEISYDGTEKLELMEDVTVIGPEGVIENPKLFANIVTAEALNEKKVTYTLDTDDGQITATRMLILKNYTGPTLKLPENMPEAEESELDSYLSLIPADDSFKALDGYGNDITSQVSASYTIEPSDPRIVHFVFSVTNMFNDKAAAAYDLSIESQRPILVLSQYSVSISKGESFQPMDYIKQAESQEGTDLYHTIVIEGSVDVNTPGKYSLTYTIEDKGVESIPQKLNVIVE